MDLLLDAIRLDEICAYVRRTFEPVAADKGLALEIVMADDVPNAILTDEQRLQQILRNLLSNAFKFTAMGGVTLRIEREDDDRLAFAVIDSGVGIAEDKLQVIFEAFQQADGTTSRTYGGTGLGLSISRELARALGGEIDVKSTLGRGRLFKLRLALAADRRVRISESELRSAGLPAPPALLTAGNGHRATIRRLVVLNRGGLAVEAVRRMVGRDHGVELICATAADEVLAACADGPPDCLVLGSRLSKSRVFALLDELRAWPGLQNLAVILHLDRAVTPRDEARLRRYSPVLEARVVATDEALAAETALVLHPAGLGEATAEPHADGTAAHPDHASLRGRRILIVDDDVRNLFALASLLEDRGLDVLFSETGREALAILGSNRQIDLVLMDIMMPQMDGYETIGAMRAIPALRELPIIAVTAKAMQGDREKSLAAGASDYITKPVDPDKLMSLIHGCLRT
jgi:CheY-like chemotaxis protein